MAIGERIGQKPDVQPIEITSEEAIIERSRRLLVAHGLLSGSVPLVPLPDDPIFRKHPGSQATYLVEQEVSPHMVYISTLASEHQTSGHSHPRANENNPDVYESYVCVSGEFKIILDDREEETLKPGDRYRVQPGIKHKVKANGGLAVLAIVMENGARYIRSERHIK